jgi:plastocyanin
MTRLARPVVIVAAALALVACGDTSVGNNDLLNIKATPKPTPQPTAAATAPPTAAPTVAHTAPPVVHSAAPTQPPTTTAPTATKFPVSVQSDSEPPGLNPANIRVYVGTIVVWTNHDSVPRSIVANNGAFNSGPIAPGASYSYTAGSVGTFDYADGTRPYVVGQVQVLTH